RRATKNSAAPPCWNRRTRSAGGRSPGRRRLTRTARSSPATRRNWSAPPWRQSPEPEPRRRSPPLPPGEQVPEPDPAEAVPHHPAPGSAQAAPPPPGALAAGAGRRGVAPAAAGPAPRPAAAAAGPPARLDPLQQGDLPQRRVQPVAAAGPAHDAEDAGGGQRAEHLDQVLFRQAVLPGDVLGGDGEALRVPGQVGQGGQGVAGGVREFHQHLGGREGAATDPRAVPSAPLVGPRPFIPAWARPSTGGPDVPALTTPAGPVPARPPPRPRAPATTAASA